MTPNERGEKAFALFDLVIKAVWVGLVVMGLMWAAIALSGADMGRLDEHEIFEYRQVAVPVLIVGYLLMDRLLSRRRAVDGAAAGTRNPAPPARGYQAELIALGLVVAGGAAFWHDHINHDIPNPVAVVGKFVSATCVDASGRRTVVGPHMSVGYEFASQSSALRLSQTKCLLDKCEPQTPPQPLMDTEFKRVFYPSIEKCRAALPDVVMRKEPTTVWTGDKDMNASVRARFTPERHAPPYFLLWVPATVAVLVCTVSIVARVRANAKRGS